MTEIQKIGENIFSHFKVGPCSTKMKKKNCPFLPLLLYVQYLFYILEQPTLAADPWASLSLNCLFIYLPFYITFSCTPHSLRLIFESRSLSSVSLFLYPSELLFSVSPPPHCCWSLSLDISQLSLYFFTLLNYLFLFPPLRHVVILWILINERHWCLSQRGKHTSIQSTLIRLEGTPQIRYHSDHTAMESNNLHYYPTESLLSLDNISYHIISQIILNYHNIIQ